MAAERPKLSWPQAATSPELRDRVANARVLAVGAGGIGCELLKTLVMSGFNHIEVIDLDTIETSNLNRQFLFRKRHVGHSKAAVAAKAVRGMRPGVDITAHQGNVKDAKHGLDFFRRFDLVLSGLDNLEARRHVNRLCLAAGVPLVESGTAGYLGQVSVHVKGATECFECAAKPSPKSYPVCTIRNTPDKPIHCVVWAKDMLFTRLFGRAEDADLDEGGAEEGTPEGEKAAAPAPEKDDPVFYTRREGEGSAEYAARIFRRVFGTDIERLLAVENLWRTRRPPTPLDLDAILGEAAAANGHDGTNGHVAAGAAAGQQQQNGAHSVGSSACRVLGLTNDHAVWDLQQNARVFLEAVRHFLDERAEDLGSAQFDKDDDLVVEFVTAASNLRALCYGIPPQSLFVAKGMAGNIIHAIATTNAIVSGLIVVEAFKLLAGALEACRTTYLRADVSNRKLLTPETSPPPQPQCVVCGTAQAQLAINTKTTTLQQLVDKVLKGRLALVEPSLMCGDFMYDEGEGLDEDEVEQFAALLPRALCALPGGGLVGGCIVDVSDQQQQLKLQLVLEHREDFGGEEENPDGFVLTGGLPAAEADPAAAPAEAGAANEAGPAAAAAPGAAGAAPGGKGGAAGAAAATSFREDEDGVVLLDSDDEGPEPGPSRAAGAAPKRKVGADDGAAAGAAGEAGQGAKRARVEAPAAARAGGEEAEVIDLLDDDQTLNGHGRT